MHIFPTTFLEIAVCGLDACITFECIITFVVNFYNFCGLYYICGQLLHLWLQQHIIIIIIHNDNNDDDNNNNINNNNYNNNHHHINPLRESQL